MRGQRNRKNGAGDGGGKRLTGSEGDLTGMGKEGGLSGLKKSAGASWAHAGGPLAKGADRCGDTGQKWQLKGASSGGTVTQSLNADSRWRLINRAPLEAGVLSH